MIKTDAPIFGRLITAMVTPFDDELKMDTKAVDKLVEHLITTGTRSIVVSGTTGESPTLEEAEKKDLLKRVILRANGEAKVIMGAGHYSTAKTIQAVKEAENLGADGLLIVAPYYNKPSQLGLFKHFEMVANATHLPIIIYNIPGRTGVNIASDTTVDISNTYKNIHALKDSTGNVDQAAEIAGKAKESFHIYSGDDYLTLPFLSVGACGVISVASHVVGSQISELMESFFQGKLDRARQLHYEYLPLFKGLFAAPNPTCVKYVLSKLGLCKEHLRLPLIALENEQKKAIDKILEKSKVNAQLSLVD